MSNSLNIQDIIAGCKQGNHKHQRALVDLYSKRLFATCIRYLKDREAARDVLQESLIRIFKYFDSYDQKKAEVYTWMTTITIRQCLKQLEKKRLEFVSFDQVSFEERSLDISPLDELQNKDLIKLINELPDGYREVFHLSVIDGYSHTEISELLNIKKGASRSRLSRAKETLRHRINLIRTKESWTEIS